MDTAWAIVELSRFIDVATLEWPSPVPGVADFRDTRRPRGGEQTVVESSQVVEQILDRVLPDWRSTVPAHKTKRWEQTREAASRAVVQLQREEELRERLGDNAPRMSMGDLHPWVWDAARSFWPQGAYRVAVREAATAVNAHTQAKVGRYDVADDALFGEVFSSSAPAEGKPRLRLPGAEDDKTRQSRQRGARDLAQGCFWALRNPATHQVDAWEEQTALESLCAFSVLARLIDECDVVKVSPSAP
jgi:uncharacterized protein (TIGR02391 family)